MAKRKKVVNPNQKNVAKAVKSIDKKASAYKSVLRDKLAQGVAPDKAASAALESTGMADAVVGIVADGVAASFKIESTGFFDKKRYLDKEYQGIKLSKLIVNCVEESSAEVAKVIKNQLSQGSSWLKMARSIEKTDLIGSDPTKRLGELATAARRAIGGNDPALMAEYTTELSKFKRHVDRLIDTDAPKGALRRAYQRVIAATESGNVAAMDAAISNAVTKKMAYNAQRIARTEMITVWGETRIADFKADEDVGGIQWMLSTSDNACEICEGNASADIGYGDGIYTFEALPEYPSHPNCMCSLLPIPADDMVKK